MTMRDRYLRRTYGITQKTYLRMFKAQKGLCFICLKPPKPGKNLHVDHNHKTQVVRGLLCWKCNHRFLGRSRENVDHHKRAVIYLSRTIDWRYV